MRIIFMATICGFYFATVVSSTAGIFGNSSQAAQSCSDPSMMAFLDRGLNATSGMSGAHFENVTTVESTETVAACHGTIVEASGAKQAGTITYTADADGHIATKWIVDQTAPPAQQSDLDKRIAARAAAMTTGTPEMRRIQAAQDEVKTEDFCMRFYASAAFVVVSYRDIGEPKEMAFDQMSVQSGVPPDLLSHLIDAAYANRFQSATGFSQDALKRCMNSTPY